MHKIGRPDPLGCSFHVSNSSYSLARFGGTEEVPDYPRGFAHTSGSPKSKSQILIPRLGSTLFDNFRLLVVNLAKLRACAFVGT